MAFESIKQRFEDSTISKNLKTIESDLAESIKVDEYPFFANATLLLHSRTYLMDHNRDSDPQTSRQRNDRYSFATGGWLSFKSGYINNWLGIGLTQYGSYKLDGNQYGEEALLLGPGQSSINVLGQAYIEILHPFGNFKVYRQKINTPFINANDSRMIPHTFEAVKISSRKGSKIDYILAYADKMKSRNSESFEDINKPINDEGVWTAGIRHRFMNEFRAGLITYHARDYMDVHYAELDGFFSYRDESAVKYALQYIQQDSTGKEQAGKINTDAWGVRLSYQLHQWQLFFNYTNVDNNNKISSPWGGYPGYNSVQVNDFNRAGEEAFGLGVSYDFTNDIFDGLTASIKYIVGDTPDEGKNASSDQNEWNIDFQYVIQSGLFEGLSTRLRYADVSRESYISNTAGYLSGLGENQFRFIVNYEIEL